jgi:NADH-quinone oxidoreductase subunit G
MIKVVVDEQEVSIPNGSTVMDACKVRGTDIPHFCYHPDLSIAGNCRMCLVEIEKMPKPIASCAFPAQEGMIIKTSSDMVIKARQNVLELMLLNHPLDCPVCDQGGECGLQDQTIAFGKGVGEYDFERRHVTSKNMGPLIKTIMTRCIHCTRCIRFMDEIAGTSEIGAVNRGEETEITTYLEQNITSELSGNIIDICPVGALTSKPYAFQCRPWELKKTDSIDVLDGVCSNIEVHVRDNTVMRILPRENREINDCWISDKTRFSYDGLKMQRLDRPYVRKNGRLVESTWEEAFLEIKNAFKKIEAHQLAALSGPLSDVESQFLLKELFSLLGSKNIDSRPSGYDLDVTNKTSYLFNSTIKGIDEADCILFVGVNPRHEATMINARIRKRFLKANISIANIGNPVDLTYYVEELGNNPEILELILKNKHPFSKIWFESKKPMVIFGENIFTRNDAISLLKIGQSLCLENTAQNKEWNGFNVLLRHTGMISGLEIDFVPSDGGLKRDEILQSENIKILYLLGVDDLERKDIKEDVFVIYQGHHGDKGAKMADVILPSAAYTEKEALFINVEGRVQSTQKALEPPYLAKEDWKIIRALSEVLLVRLPFNTREEIINKLRQKNERFAHINQVLRFEIQKIEKESTKISSIPFDHYHENYYMTDIITRNSQTMADCIKNFQKG